MARLARKSKGRQKIRMVKMANDRNLQVTFSKRRSGIFKKANELCTLCGAQMAIIVFSPGGKVFSFGHPNVDTVVDHYLIMNLQPLPHQGSDTARIMEAHRNATVRELNADLTEVYNKLEIEKKLNEELNRLSRLHQENPNPSFAGESSSAHPNTIPNVEHGGMGIMPPPHAHPHPAWNDLESNSWSILLKKLTKN